MNNKNAILMRLSKPELDFSTDPSWTKTFPYPWREPIPLLGGLGSLTFGSLTAGTYKIRLKLQKSEAWSAFLEQIGSPTLTIWHYFENNGSKNRTQISILNFTGKREVKESAVFEADGLMEVDLYFGNLGTKLDFDNTLQLNDADFPGTKSFAKNTFDDLVRYSELAESG